ncbi:MAG: hypothetical protein COS14_08150 [Bacteroidetes bacterium CG02_land_8_20_14_3_00_31_25]|nr:DUF86 domain-containing protein [Bacteroidota bacterium]OFX28901.1 MAG: hypothetical protein A2X08_14440 [Bacteroidetes bacterium GWA2_32_17]PIV58712.1 MAG: hypothetical protein COS14_08150 [Bacteroidetes bacterium CG02_land_8_20_14_3_00_31_25]PIY02796.1 MAG: hypothetical protein COZ21_12310 [Bacteroidetes bacterium CG_4_10_14_3_um_filter_31_20]
MRNKTSDKERLLHILEAINNIEEFTDGISYNSYIDDFKLRLALIKLFEIIGEASNGITEDLQNKFTNVEWSILKGIRNILVHEYFGIDYDVIWDSIKNNIPELKEKITQIINELK